VNYNSIDIVAFVLQTSSDKKSNYNVVKKQLLEAKNKTIEIRN
jgi:hypothetical protein